MIDHIDRVFFAHPDAEMFISIRYLGAIKYPLLWQNSGVENGIATFEMIGELQQLAERAFVFRLQEKNPNITLDQVEIEFARGLDNGREQRWVTA